MIYSDELKDLVRQLDESVKRTQAKIDILKKMIDDDNRQDYAMFNDMLEKIENSSDWDQYDLNNIKDIN
jgi:hypothetical protein